jgi:cell wall-associated NlpC family hydrolase
VPLIAVSAKTKGFRHTARMRRGVVLLLFGVLLAALGVASARASGTGTTTTTGATTVTTTGTSTTTPAPSYAPLGTSALPTGCVGAGAAAAVPPAHPVVALGTPASNLGPSGYPASGSVVAFSSASVSGSTCSNTTLTLASVSLFDGTVTASSVEATDGKGTVAGLEIDGTAVSAATGQTVSVESWGQLTLGEKVGRLRAPLVLRLLQAHDGLLAGTEIAVAFSAAAQPVLNPRKHHPSPSTHNAHKTRAAGSRQHAKNAAKKTKKRGRREPYKPPPDFPAAPSPLTASGGLTDAAEDNPVISIAVQYLGVPYQWGGARPKTGFDCSGLVQYVFAQLGVPLVHYAAAQWHSPGGVWVPPDRLQAGDLVFFIGSDGTRKAPGHVGIYVGDGYLIDAPHTGAFVRIDSLNERKLANQYVGARRIASQPFLARHLLHVTKPAASTASNRPGFPLPIPIEPLGESFGVAAAGTAAIRTESRGYWMWAGLALGVLLLPLCAAGFLIRRRQPPEASPSGEASN